MSDALVFLKKWGATVMFVLFILAHAITLTRLYDQNHQLETLVQENRVLVQETATFFERTLEAECEIRVESRHTVREIFRGILGQFDPSPRIDEILHYIDTDFPEITCEEITSNNPILEQAGVHTDDDTVETETTVGIDE